MRVLTQATETIPIDALRLHPRNPRQGDIGAIHESIKNNGFYGSIIAQRSTGYILAGNHRWKAAQQDGATEIPVTWIDVDDDHALRILLADNRTNDLASYNDEALAELLKDIHENSGTLLGTGYDGDDLDELLDDLGREGQPAEEPPEAQVDRADELQEKWQTELGQLWQIGTHRLLCGDSTDESVVARLMAGATAALVNTDPPYGVSYDGGTTKRKALDGDKTPALYEPALRMAHKHSRPDAACYLWHSDSKSAAVSAAVSAAGYERRSTIIWNKNLAQFGALGAQYKTKHEPCHYLHKRGQAPAWYGPTNEVTVWDVAREQKNEHHPTQKPPELAARACRNSAKAGEVVLDLFGGSGSTLVGAEQTGRVAYLCELDPAYVAVTLERLADMGLTPELADA